MQSEWHKRDKSFLKTVTTAEHFRKDKEMDVKGFARSFGGKNSKRRMIDACEASRPAFLSPSPLAVNGNHFASASSAACNTSPISF